MVCRMISHQGRFQKKSFSCVLWAFPHVFFLFCWEKVFLDGFLVVFTVVWSLVWLLDPPLIYRLYRAPIMYIYFYILYFIKWSKSCLHAPFVCHASFAVRFHFDFFSTCFVTFESPSCKQVSFHSILTNSLSICLHHQLHHLPLAPYISWLALIIYILTQHLSIPHGDDFTFLPLKRL